MAEPRRGTVPWFAMAVVAVLVNTPLVHGTLTGADPGALVLLVTLVADVALVSVVVLRRYAAPPGE